MPTRPKNARTKTESKQSSSEIQAPKGKLGIMIPGMGAVATTFVAGVEAVRKGIAKPIGSLTQMGTIRLGKRTDALSPKIKEFVPLASLNDLVFTGWDIFEDNMYSAASKAGVLERELLEQVKPLLTSITPRKAVFDHNYVKKIDGPNVKKGKNKMDLAEQVRADMRDFRKTSGASRLVTIWCGSTESFIEPTAAHQSLKAFEKALTQNDEMIAPSMIYAYASLMEGVPFANGAPNLTVDLPVMQELSRENSAPICGKDYKTGQTLIKTILAPGFKARMIGLNGWFSTTFWAIATAKCWKIRVLSKLKKSPSCRCWNTFCSRNFIPNCTASSRTRCASTITRRAGTTKKAGTISTSSDGWVIPCRSKLISCAATRFWPRRLCSTWCCFSIWRSAARSCAGWASRSG
jgi:myo-inositol-1-phosphate synthase